MQRNDRRAPGQLARLQRWVGWVLLLSALAVAWGLTALGAPGWAAALAAVATLFAHAWVLAIEFLLLGRVNPGAGLPRPGGRLLLRAWWHEVRTGLLVFGWRQPYRSHSVPDELDPELARGRRGVLFVHGFVCNRGLWNPLMARLRASGAPYLAVNLEPVFGSIEAYVPILDAAVSRIQAATGQPPLVVAHSMGGLAVRAWLRAHGADARVHAVITVGSPHHGTWLARFGFTANVRQMRRHGVWASELAAAEPDARRARFTCFFSHADNIVFPAEAAMLAGADNRHLPGVAHVHLVYRPEVWIELSRRLADETSPPAQPHPPASAPNTDTSHAAGALN